MFAHTTRTFISTQLFESPRRGVADTHAAPMRLHVGGLIADGNMDDASNLHSDASLMARSSHDLVSTGCSHSCATVASLLTHMFSPNKHVCPIMISSFEISPTKLTRVSEAMCGSMALIPSCATVSAFESFQYTFSRCVIYPSSGNHQKV